MFCQWRGGVGWPLWLQAGPPARPPVGRQPVVIGVESWLPRACFLQLSEQAGWRAGEEAPGLQAPAEPPVTTREQWPGGAGGFVPGQPCLFQAPTSDGDRVLQGLRPLPHLVFHLAGHIVSHHGAKENSGLRKCLWAVAGALQLWEVAEWEEGTRAGPALHRLHSAWDCS